jgi:hypothetical protein
MPPLPGLRTVEVSEIVEEDWDERERDHGDTAGHLETVAADSTPDPPCDSKAFPPPLWATQAPESRLVRFITNTVDATAFCSLTRPGSRKRFRKRPVSQTDPG